MFACNKAKVFWVMLWAWCGVQAYAGEALKMEIVLDKPTFVLPQFTGPYRDREASIAPEEYEMAEKLTSLLHQENKQQVLEQLEEFYDLELSPAMLTLKAQVYFSLKMFVEAERTYLAVLARKPHLVRAHADLGQLYLVTENADKARKHLARAVSLGSNDAVIHGQLAYLNLTNYGAFSAISEYQQAMALEPENFQWQQGLLAALSQAHMYEAASALLREMLVRKPREKSLWLNRAAIALELEDRETALASLEMAILLGDESSQNLKTAASLHLQLNSFERAFELVSVQLKRGELEMRQVGEYLEWLGSLEMWAEAEKLVARVAEQKMTLSSGHRSLYYLHVAKIYQAQGYTQLAQDAYESALNSNPANAEALLSYARFLVKNKNFVKAELIYIRARSVEASEQRAYLGLSQMYVELKDYEAALDQLNEVYVKYPTLTDVKENIIVIENIIRAKNTHSSL